MENIILNTHKQLGDQALITSGYRIVNKMDDNPLFTDANSSFAGYYQGYSVTYVLQSTHCPYKGLPGAA